MAVPTVYGEEGVNLSAFDATSPAFWACPERLSSTFRRRGAKDPLANARACVACWLKQNESGRCPDVLPHSPDTSAGGPSARIRRAEGHQHRAGARSRLLFS